MDLEGDRSALDKIYRATCNPALQEEPAWTISSYLWCHPYPILSSQTCFVLDSGTGEAVGYVLGTPNTRDFAARWPRAYTPNLDRSKLLPPPGYKARALPVPTWDSDLPSYLLHLLYNDHIGLLNGSYPDMLDQYPAHLHINLLPGYRRQGWGQKMIATFCDTVRMDGASGVHLGMEARNADAGKFYSSIGFERFPRVISDDVDGRLGETSSVIYMVKDLR